MSGALGAVPLRHLGRYVAQNFKLGAIPDYTARAVQVWRGQYVTCRNAALTPFWHCVGVVMLLNYMIEYKHLKKERIRKYH